MNNPNNTDNELSKNQVELVLSALENHALCPFDTGDHGILPDQPCPVCGSYGTGNNIYCADDFRIVKLTKA